ncbi:hypothetical protein BOX15_Mlig020996g1 [Macrostomum lignano]|uniref:Uncharacterized protein n=1 Tax=Macrostomum lignano TaxID=282301 RepID=A0A267E3P6_9PLAT|nr:hypothetical protein BOX15_Mlig020996g3 [Macrostomum lignano]PAA66221.1 hypothetical protein BOX15_Mlig020996g2 [Macrostomum lignano]PAA72795.1 hypothetical protein BOX15_Mlig020996g1 [Macrostomum lignano]
MGYLSPTVESYLQSAGLHLALFVVCCLVCYYWTEISAAPGRLLESLLQRGLRKTVLGPLYFYLHMLQHFGSECPHNRAEQPVNSN